MRFVCFSQDGSSLFGIVKNDIVHGFPESVATLGAYLALDPNGRDALPTHAIGPISEVALGPPVHPHKNVFCVGRNYMGHAEEIARARGTELRLPSVPTFFTKAPTAIVGPDATIHLSGTLSSEYDYEAELAVVIGTRCRDVSERDALGVVFGYTCLNDVTARDLQKEHQQWFKGKSLDETCPVGPWIVSADEIGDPGSLDIAMRIDGVTKQSSNTAHMIFNVAQIIASLSAGLTLEPGDTIATGTPDGVGFARTPPEFLRDGTRMEVEIAKIGILRTTVALSPAR
jgi:2-keto-4-pentenoate hydratase/2-oxohepta-3-ene-1,7-dioic acid hydratase in catechol pathway